MGQAVRPVVCALGELDVAADDLLGESGGDVRDHIGGRRLLNLLERDLIRRLVAARRLALANHDGAAGKARLAIEPQVEGVSAHEVGGVEIRLAVCVGLENPATLRRKAACHEVGPAREGDRVVVIDGELRVCQRSIPKRAVTLGAIAQLSVVLLQRELNRVGRGLLAALEGARLAAADRQLVDVAAQQIALGGAGLLGVVGAGQQLQRVALAVLVGGEAADLLSKALVREHVVAGSGKRVTCVARGQRLIRANLLELCPGVAHGLRALDDRGLVELALHPVGLVAQLMPERRLGLLHVIGPREKHDLVALAVLVGGEGRHALLACLIREDPVLGPGKRVVAVRPVDFHIQRCLLEFRGTVDHRLLAGDLRLLAKAHGHAVNLIAQLVAGRRGLLLDVIGPGQHLDGVGGTVLAAGQRRDELGAARIREDLVLGAGQRVVGVRAVDLDAGRDLAKRQRRGLRLLGAVEGRGRPRRRAYLMDLTAELVPGARLRLLRVVGTGQHVQRVRVARPVRHELAHLGAAGRVCVDAVGCPGQAVVGVACNLGARGFLEVHVTRRGLLGAGEGRRRARAHRHRMDLAAQLVPGARAGLLRVVGARVDLQRIAVAVCPGDQRPYKLGARRVREDAVLGPLQAVSGVAGGARVRARLAQVDISRRRCEEEDVLAARVPLDDMRAAVDGRVAAARVRIGLGLEIGPHDTVLREDVRGLPRALTCVELPVAVDRDVGHAGIETHHPDRGLHHGGRLHAARVPAAIHAKGRRVFADGARYLRVSGVDQVVQGAQLCRCVGGGGASALDVVGRLRAVVDRTHAPRVRMRDVHVAAPGEAAVRQPELVGARPVEDRGSAVERQPVTCPRRGRELGDSEREELA